ncbi:MAG: glycosyltransferase family 4 protein [Desulfovibrionaceae bacterium]|nr:glycosyltransferase family 4 protein [Desulfovibrionaceae bacterium]
MSQEHTRQHAAPMPHVAYVLLWYPVFTQPFIFREVEGLKKAGLPLTVYSLYGRSLRQCSDEMRAAAYQTYSFGLRALGIFLLAFFRRLFCRPRDTLCLVREMLCRRWLRMESTAEALWGFLAGIYFARLFTEAGIDLIHAPWPRGAATAAWAASRLSGIPFSLAVRGDNLDPAEPDLVDKMEECLFIRANNQADKARMQRLLTPAVRDKIDLVYNSLTLRQEACRPACLMSPVRLLAVGRFSATKGFEYLLEACNILHEKNFSFTLTLVGGSGLAAGGYLGPQLARMRATRGLKELVRMPGFVSHNELPQLLETHDIFVAPCIIAPSGERDGIPNVIIEAMAFGLPVISTRVNAIPEIVRNGETGITVPQRDAAALAEAVLYMCAHPDEARLMAANGRKLALEIFDEASNIRKLRDMFVTRYMSFKETASGGGEQRV